MPDLRVPQWRLLVLADGDTPQHRANARGHLFEVFVATLLKSYGYGGLDKQVLQHTSDGIEIDVWTKP